MTHTQSGNLNTEIKRRSERADILDKNVRGDLINKAQSFKNYNILENKLNLKIKSLLIQKKNTQNALTDARKQLNKTKKSRLKLGNEHEGIVTEHAMLRYLERYHHIDMNQINQEILKLPSADLVKCGNVVVTVYPSQDELATQLEHLEGL